MTLLLSIAQERIGGGILLLSLCVLFVWWFLSGWKTIGDRKPETEVKSKRAWTQKEMEEFEFLKRVNEREKQ